MEILRQRLLAMAKRDQPFGKPGSMSGPPLFAMRRFAEERQALAQLRLSSHGKNLLHVGAIRARSERLVASARRCGRKCRSQLLARADLPGVGGSCLRATRELLCQFVAHSPAACGGLRESPRS